MLLQEAQLSRGGLLFDGTDNRVLLNDRPDIVIATPSKALALLQAKTLVLTHLSLLCIDEADLLLSYGHSADVQRLVDPSSGFIPKLGVQAILLSATLTSDVDALKGFILRNPAILRLSEPSSSTNLTQYSITTSEQDKFLMIYVLLKLKLIKGKALLFVNSVERGYRLRLFLEQFGIRSCVVNEGLPLNSRYHIVEEFNKGVYDYIIATDEADLGGDDNESESESEGERDTEEEVKEDELAEAKKRESSVCTC
jgi:ATP-dependent RNA helicase DDX56/DBP9